MERQLWPMDWTPNMNKPEYNKIYALTGSKSDKCISNSNTWKESEVPKLDHEMAKSFAMSDIGLTEDEADEAVADFYSLL